MKKSMPEYTAHKHTLAAGASSLLLLVTLPRRSEAEETLDFKTLYYVEDNDRMTVISPMVRYEKELSSTLTIKIEGIYNSISGATPTGAPPAEGTKTVTRTIALPGTTTAAASASATAYQDDDDDHDDDDDENEAAGFVGASNPSSPSAQAAQAINAPFAGVAGATPTASPAPGTTSTTNSGGGSQTVTETVPNGIYELPKAHSEDERIAFNIELIKKLDRHAVSGLVSYSSESDYDSLGLAITDTIDFNQKNTTLSLGAAYTMDTISTNFGTASEDKTSVDFLIGITQVVTPNTLFTANLTYGFIDGYLTDPYKVSEVNGQLVIEKRPDTKDKQILFLSTSHYFPSLRGSVEGSFRYYTDSFGIDSQTYTLSWYQKIGENFILRPQLRLYDQSAADFYGVRFTGSPEFYSSDYRVSSFSSTGVGLKAIWTPNPRLQLDAEVMSYSQSGNDGITSDEAYPSAQAIILGIRFWL